MKKLHAIRLATYTHPWVKYLLIMLPVIYSFQCFAGCPLPAPAGLKSYDITSCQFSVKWKAVSSAVSYSLQYKRNSDNGWEVINGIGNVTSITLSALEANTTYFVKVAPVCSSHEVGTFTTPIVVATLPCTAPDNITFSGISATSATISWEGTCNTSKFNLRYRMKGTSQWTTIANITTTLYTLSGLQSGSTYEVKLKSICGSGSSGYSPSVYFTTLSTAGHRNVLLIILDDARFDSYSASGGPSFFNDVNISRIANEGVNFTQSFAVLSWCAPSRASIITGLYPHIHGVTDNVTTNYTLSNVTVAQILQNNGYYTGLIGKYHISGKPQPGFDFWMECHDSDYFNAPFMVDSTLKIISGHQTDIVSDTAISFFHKVPEGKPFFLWLGYRSPHGPPDPRPEDDGLFDNFEMPFPDNYTKYEKNFPEFIYDCHSTDDSAGIYEYYRGYFEMLQGTESRLGDVLSELENMGLMDSTLIIFMSDNGYLIGEHKLIKKQLAYEESMRIPIFMRYPLLIPENTVISDQIALNIDIAPTILDFAGIPDTFGLQGISLIDVIKGNASRTEMMYEFYNDDCIPDIRAVRSLDYKYISYNCTDETEEFFYLNTDPDENNNLINKPAFAALIQEYRDKLVFWRNYYQDFTWDSLYDCSLSNPQRLVNDADKSLALLNTFPNPANASIVVHFISSESATGSLSVINTFGITIHEEIFGEAHTGFSISIPLNHLAAGNYFVVVRHGHHSYWQSFVRN